MHRPVFATSWRRTAAVSAGAVLCAVAVPAPAALAAHPGSGTAKRAAIEQLEAGRGAGGAASSATSLRRAMSARRSAAGYAATDEPLADPPTSTPTDLAVTGTAGDVTFTATSTAAFVAFQFNDVALTPVAVASGQASTTFATWGRANGMQTVTATDCTSTDPTSCNTASPASTSFDLENSAPTVTSPAGYSQITGGFTISALSDGGGVRFLIDGERVGFAATSPYTFAYTGSALAAGTHVITAVQCSADEGMCDGPQSAAVTIMSNSLYPKITSVYPSTFSPNGDHVKDTTKLTYYLPDTEHVSLTITNSRGTAVRGPGSLGTLARGSHTWVWNGRDHSGAVVPSGTYRITLNTSATIHGALVKGQVWRSVVVDDRAPSVSSLTYNGTVYPYRDGYKDSFVAKFHLSERASVTLRIYTATNHTVRSLTGTRSAGSTSISWSGRDVHGHMVPAGTYRWTITVKDAVGNWRRTAMRHVVVSWKKLISRSVTILRNGDSFASAGGSDSSCTEASTGLSQYPHGVWLLNTCFDESAVAAAFYHVTVPSAAVYSHFTVSVYGFAMDAPTSIETAFGVHGGSSDFGIGGLYDIRSHSEGWYTIGSIGASRYVSSTHRANIGVSVDSADAPCDFDIKQVKIHLSYKVLG